jgi:hypothetical protein
MLSKVKINRNAKISLFPFKDYFQGFDELDAVKGIFGRNTSRILDRVKLEFYSGSRGYMGVHNGDGHIRINATYLKEGETRGLYLDVIHELVHVKQFMDARELFDRRFDYVDRPTELEAYTVAVNEARKIGMSEFQIFRYLKMESMSKRAHERLARKVGVKIPRRKIRKRN